MKKYIYYPIVRIISIIIFLVSIFIISCFFFPLFIFTGLDNAHETCNSLANNALETIEKYGKM